MVRPSRYTAWLLSAATLVALGSGCSSMSKSPASADAKGKSPSPVAATANPGSPEFKVGNKLNDPVKVHLAYALWHEQDGHPEQARSSYDKVLSESPKNVDAMLGLSRLDIALGRMDDAEKRLLKAQKLAPKNPQVSISLGQYYSARNDWPHALEHMKTARALSPYDPACAYHLGYVQAKSGDLNSALASFTEAVGPAEAQYNLAYILHEQGNLVAAEEHLQRAISLKPDLAQAQSLLLAVRQQRSGARGLLAQAPPNRGTPAAAPSGVQPASYTEPQKTSSFDPAPPR